MTRPAHRAPRTSSPAGHLATSMGRRLAFVVALTAGPAHAADVRPGPSPLPSVRTPLLMGPGSGGSPSDFRKNLEADVDVLVGELEANEKTGFRRPAPLPVVAAYRGPCQGVLFIPREVGGRRSFAALLLEEPVGPLIEGFEGTAIDTPTWTKEGTYLAFIVRRLSLMEVGGDLWILRVAEPFARRIDQNVTKFAIAPEGMRWVYERLREPDLHAPRDLIAADFSQDTPRTRVVEPLEYPTFQLEELGPWGVGTAIPYTVADYREGLDRPRRVSKTWIFEVGGR